MGISEKPFSKNLRYRVLEYVQKFTRWNLWQTNSRHDVRINRSLLNLYITPGIVIIIDLCNNTVWSCLHLRSLVKYKHLDKILEEGKELKTVSVQCYFAFKTIFYSKFLRIHLCSMYMSMCMEQWLKQLLGGIPRLYNLEPPIIIRVILSCASEYCFLWLELHSVQNNPQHLSVFCTFGASSDLLDPCTPRLLRRPQIRHW